MHKRLHCLLIVGFLVLTCITSTLCYPPPVGLQTDLTTCLADYAFPQPPTLYVSNKEGLYYQTQLSTGDYAAYNCGPSCLWMLEHWLGRTPPSVATIRDMIQPEELPVYTGEILDYLATQSIPYTLEELTTIYQTCALLNQGAILLICFDASQLTYSPNQLINRFYTGVKGHYALITGYVATDHALYFEVQDPYALTIPTAYTSTAIRMTGESVFYESADLHGAIASWWPYLIVFEHK